MVLRKFERITVCILAKFNENFTKIFILNFRKVNNYEITDQFPESFGSEDHTNELLIYVLINK
jgi:hypothetical protein